MEIKIVSKYGINEGIIKEYIEKVENQEKIIAVSGEFSAGKSTFINALVNKKNFLPSANVECTPILIDLIKDDGQVIEIKYNDGSVKCEEATEENINKYARNQREYDKDIVGITIPVKSDYLFEKFHLIDTPGTNTLYKEHEIITKEILRKSDLVIYIFNKSLTKHDLLKIEEIMNYTEDILFIVSNMDEQYQGEYVNRKNEQIHIFIEEAKNSLKNIINGEPLILPVGSQASYDHPELINDIRDTIKMLSQLNNEKKVRENAKRQLSVIFEKRLKEMNEELLVNKSILEIDEENLNNKINKFNKKIREIKLDEENLSETVKNKVEINKQRIRNEIYKIYSQIQEEVTKKVLDDKGQENFDKIFEEASVRVNERVKQCLNKFIDNIIKESYLDNNLKIEGINTELNIKLESNINEPTLEELDLSYDKDILRLKEKEIMVNSKIDTIIQEVAVESNSIEEYKNQLENFKQEAEAINEKLGELGSYIPEYDEIVDESGEGVGRSIGRFIGEVADVALIFYNPGSAVNAGSKVIKTADKVKDTVKLTQYLAKGVKATQNGVNTANNIIKEANVVSDGKLLKTLDLLSIGGLGERIGGALGKVIKPGSTIYVENEEKKALWISENEAISVEKQAIISKQEILEEKINNGKINIIEAMRRKRELEAELTLNKKREEALIARKEKEYEYNSMKNIGNYYSNEIEAICNAELEDTILKVNWIMEEVITEIITKSSIEFNNRLDIIERSIEEAANNREKLQSKLSNDEILISELCNYKVWINEWLS